MMFAKMSQPAGYSDKNVFHPKMMHIRYEGDWINNLRGFAKAILWKFYR